MAVRLHNNRFLLTQFARECERDHARFGLQVGIGIPLAAGASAPSASSLPQIDQVLVYNPAGGGLDSTYNPNIAAAWCGTLSSGETNAYHECMSSYPNGAASGGNSYAAWSAADTVLGVNSSNGFALYYYDLSPALNATNQGLYDIFLTGTLPIGTIEIAYGCATGTCGNYCYVTPFTNAGQVVPEPSSFLLVGGAAPALITARLRRKRQ